MGFAPSGFVGARFCEIRWLDLHAEFARTRHLKICARFAGRGCETGFVGLDSQGFAGVDSLVRFVVWIRIRGAIFAGIFGAIRRDDF